MSSKACFGAEFEPCSCHRGAGLMSRPHRLL